MSGIFDTGVFDTGIFDHQAQTPSTYQYLGSPIQYVTGNKVRYAWEGDDENEKPVKKVTKLGPVRQTKIEIGIVNVRPKKHTPNTDQLNRLALESVATDRKTRQRIRQMIARDDDWLMSL